MPSTILFSSTVFMTQPGTIIVQAYDTTTKGTYLHRSLDNGLTWTRSESLPPLEKISFTSLLDVWGVGSERTGIGDAHRDVMAHSTDGGMSWTRLPHETIGGGGGGLTAIDFVDAMNGIAVGRSGRILRTTDGGTTWRHEYINYEDARGSGLRAVGFGRIGRAFVVGQAGPIFAHTGKLTLAPPTFLARTGADGINNVRVEWNAIEGATHYRLQVASESVDDWYYDWSIFERSFVDTILTQTHLVLNDLEYWHRHHMRVRAMNDSQQSEWGRGVFVTVKQGALPVPRILTPTQGALDQPVTITFTWEAIPGAASYDLQVGTDRFFMDALTYSDSMITETSRVVSGLKASTFYLARMRVRMAGAIGEWSSSTGFRTTSGVSSVAANSSDATRQLTLSPNPVSGNAIVASITGRRSSIVELELVNALGVCVRRVTSSASIATIPIDGLPAGLYFVRVVGELTLGAQPVVIRR
ncbi:MAG: T9SS type A sorting domain-containing protein [bacterium]|nr:T9SS type A sorting domain-containing protein [Candidatus Kapabacteria bacterium]